ALQLLRSCRHFLIVRLDMAPAEAHAYTQGLASSVMSRLAERPGTYGVCRLAQEMGVSHYRGLLIDSYRIIYRFWPDEHQASVYLFA
ncbi:hypothetical protein C1X52_32670, partial [Pseudomonas sp. FW306-2-1A-C05A]